MIYTSYYSNYKNFKGFLKIGISRTVPPNSCDLILRFLAPNSSILFSYKQGKIGEEEYSRRYLSSLNDVKDHGTLAILVNYLKNNHRDMVLLCYESPEKFCHRHILADFLNKEYNLNIQEL